MSDNEYWTTPRLVEQKDCVRCGEDHTILYHPWPTGSRYIGHKEVRGYVNEDAELVAFGYCENSGELVQVLGEGWERKEEYGAVKRLTDTLKNL